MLKLHACFKTTRWKAKNGWFPKHYTDGLDLTFELIEKFRKNHNGIVRFTSGVRPLFTVQIANHAITFDCDYKDASEKLAMAMLECIADEKKVNGN